MVTVTGARVESAAGHGAAAASPGHAAAFSQRLGHVSPCVQRKRGAHLLLRVEEEALEGCAVDNARLLRDALQPHLQEKAALCTTREKRCDNKKHGSGRVSARLRRLRRLRRRRRRDRRRRRVPLHSSGLR